MKKNIFCDSLRLSATALSMDKTLKMKWVDYLPEDASAGYNRYKNEILMPKINTIEITDEEAKKFNFFSYHERLHHCLTNNVMEFAIIEDNKEHEKEIQNWFQSKCKTEIKCDIKKGIYATLTNFIEDCRIEKNEHYRLEGDLEDLHWYREIESVKRIEENKDILMSQNPIGSVMTFLQYHLCNYHFFNIDKNKYPQINKLYEAAWKILNDGRFTKSCSQTKRGGNTSFRLAKEIIKIWGTIDNKIKEKFDKSQTKENGKYRISSDELKEEITETIKIKSKNKNKNNKKKDNKILVSNDIDFTSYLPYNVFDRVIYPAPSPKKYQKIKNSISHKINSTKRELIKLLVGNARTRTQKYLKHGKLDRTRFNAILSFDRRIFKKIKLGVKNRAAIQLVIDLSGSMINERIKLASQVACLFAEILNIINIPFEIIGFNSSPQNKENNIRAQSLGLDRYSDVVNNWVFKEFNEPWTSVHNRLGTCLKDNYGLPISFGGNKIIKNMPQCVLGANIDHESIMWGAHRLWSQKPKRKIQIVLSDGQPSGYGGDYHGKLKKMLILTNQKIVKSGIEQIVFDIQCGKAYKYYSKSVYIKKLNDLCPETLKFLGLTFKNKKIRYK